MRRRRPAPLPDTGASIVPLTRAQRGRSESGDAGSASATPPRELRDGARSRFGELTPATGTSTSGAAGMRQQRPSAPRAPARARRANAAPEPHDGWTFVLVPPGADARPRTLRISVRRLRFAVASFFVLLGTTVVTGGILVFALSFLPAAQDEVRGIELGVFAPATTDSWPDSARAENIGAPGAIAAAPRTRRSGRPLRGSADEPGAGSEVSPSIMESLPVVGEITSRFARARRHPLLGVVRKHAGIDIAAPAGTHITAPAGGRVTFSGRKFGYGYTVEIDHGNGVVTRYAHCRALVVRAGDEVAAGAVIATVGRSGLATAPHLHYEVLVHGRNVNPLRTPLASLLEGKAPATSSSPPQPEDSALRSPATPDAISAPDMPELPDLPELSFFDGDTTPVAPPPSVARAPVVTSVLPLPVAGVRDTTRKS
jgi:murein DD-endopeptidase MepM/ murein hydrolase activator NlpD